MTLMLRIASILLVAASTASAQFIPATGEWYDPVNHKTWVRSILIAEVGDTPDVGIRRANGTADAPTPVLAHEVIGHVWFEALGPGGDWGQGPSPYYRRGAQLQARAIGEQTATSSAGQLESCVTPVGSTVVRCRAFLASTGQAVLLGRGALEDNAVDPVNFQPLLPNVGTQTVLVPRLPYPGAPPGLGPGVSWRLTYAPLYGWDWGVDGATGDLILFRVVNGVPYEVKRFSW